MFALFLIATPLLSWWAVVELDTLIERRRADRAERLAAARWVARQR